MAHAARNNGPPVLARLARDVLPSVPRPHMNDLLGIIVFELAHILQGY
jgi:hypothetical protein